MEKIVQFPEAGEGIELSFRNKDFRDLNTKLGDSYMSDVPSGILRYDFKVLDVVIGVAAKKDGKRVEVKLDDLDVLPEVIQQKLLDAWAYSQTGLDWVEHQVFLVKQGRELAEKLEGPKKAPGVL